MELTEVLVHLISVVEDRVVTHRVVGTEFLIELETEIAFPFGRWVECSNLAGGVRGAGAAIPSVLWD